MRWRGRRKSSNIEDRRGQRTGGGMRLPVGGKGLGGGIGTIIIILVAMYFGVDPSMFLGGGSGAPLGQSSSSQQPYQASPEEQELADLVAVVLADTEVTWNQLFRQSGSQYREPKLVLFSGVVNSACGRAQSAMGPFYCPADQKVYIDLSFYDDLRRRFGAPGDFAQAYVVAHEVGHHIQNILGISGQVHQQQQRLGKAEANRLSVKLELQADCLAGVWANHADRARDLLEAGDVDEALRAASAIGDDRLQQQSSGRVVPESFTHGTSEQRMRWFRTGLDSGSFERCDTFEASRL
ncbi:MAG: neutral zinc metallopeptidase [Wenzhouxiangellaceae bacterium]